MFSSKINIICTRSRRALQEKRGYATASNASAAEKVDLKFVRLSKLIQCNQGERIACELESWKFNHSNSTFQKYLKIP